MRGTITLCALYCTHAWRARGALDRQTGPILTTTHTGTDRQTNKHTGTDTDTQTDSQTKE